MSIQKYKKARKKALKIMSFGLLFLLFPTLVGVPICLIIMPFLAGRLGAKELPKNWHMTYIITVGGGWAISLAAAVFIILSLGLGPALRINTAELLIFAIMIIFNWTSFTIGANTSKGSVQNVETYESEWEEEDASTIAVTQEENTSASEKLKQLFSKSTNKKTTPETKKEKKNIKMKTTRRKPSSKKKENRVNALASRRRK